MNRYRIVWNAEQQCWDVMWSGSTSRAARFESLLEAEQYVIEHGEVEP